MPIRLRVPSSGLPFRGAKARAGAGPDACVRARPALLALCLWLCVQMSSGILAFQAIPSAATRRARSPADAAAPADSARNGGQGRPAAGSTALESLDAEQVKKMNPSVDSERLKGAFRDMRELKVTIDNIKVTIRRRYDRARELPGHADVHPQGGNETKQHRDTCDAAAQAGGGMAD